MKPYNLQATNTYVLLYTHIDGDPRQLENGDLLILIAGDEPKELVAVLSKRISLIIYI